MESLRGLTREKNNGPNINQSPRSLTAAVKRHYAEMANAETNCGRLPKPVPLRRLLPKPPPSEEPSPKRGASELGSGRSMPASPPYSNPGHQRDVLGIPSPFLPPPNITEGLPSTFHVKVYVAMSEIDPDLITCTQRQLLARCLTGEVMGLACAEVLGWGGASGPNGSLSWPPPISLRGAFGVHGHRGDSSSGKQVPSPTEGVPSMVSMAVLVWDTIGCNAFEGAENSVDNLLCMIFLKKTLDYSIIPHFEQLHGKYHPEEDTPLLWKLFLERLGGSARRGLTITSLKRIVMEGGKLLAMVKKLGLAVVFLLAASARELKTTLWDRDFDCINAWCDLLLEDYQYHSFARAVGPAALHSLLNVGSSLTSAADIVNNLRVEGVSPVIREVVEQVLWSKGYDLNRCYPTSAITTIPLPSRNLFSAEETNHSQTPWNEDRPREEVEICATIDSMGEEEPIWCSHYTVPAALFKELLPGRRVSHDLVNAFLTRYRSRCVKGRYAARPDLYQMAQRSPWRGRELYQILEADLRVKLRGPELALLLIPAYVDQRWVLIETRFNPPSLVLYHCGCLAAAARRTLNLVRLILSLGNCAGTVVRIPLGPQGQPGMDPEKESAIQMLDLLRRRLTKKAPFFFGENSIDLNRGLILEAYLSIAETRGELSKTAIKWPVRTGYLHGLGALD